MVIDTERIDDCVLALLLLGLHGGYRVWKTFELGRDGPAAQGFISDPVGRAKSVVLIVEGQERAEQLFRDLFEKDE